MLLFILLCIVLCIVACSKNKKHLGYASQAVYMDVGRMYGLGLPPLCFLY